MIQINICIVYIYIYIISLNYLNYIYIFEIMKRRIQRLCESNTIYYREGLKPCNSSTSPKKYIVV